MVKQIIDAYALLQRVKAQKPLIHHITNWVTIYECANVVKVFGASPVMAHAGEEAADMAALASALVLNIGTLTSDIVVAMKKAARSANTKGIPVVLDVCGAGATALRDTVCADIMDSVRVDVIKGNASEIARVSGHKVVTKGVDSSAVAIDMYDVARSLAREKSCTVVVTGVEDIVADSRKTYFVRNGHALMSGIVGTGCMAASVIGTFVAVEKDYAYAAAGGLVCFEIAAQLAAAKAGGPGTFKELLFDRIASLTAVQIKRMQNVRMRS